MHKHGHESRSVCEAGAKLKRCSSEGCTNRALRRVKHGAKFAKKKCSIEGCSSYAMKGGVCMKHGAKRKQCCSEECTNMAMKGGACVRRCKDETMQEGRVYKWC
mmetsp:Transcript_32162/g.48574  ORF Transcript_32162/g.48574 Transcript_32162/m.48574 type:complete len:104 (-) Transcript_32162:330-641(-)